MKLPELTPFTRDSVEDAVGSRDLMAYDTIVMVWTLGSTVPEGTDTPV